MNAPQNFPDVATRKNTIGAILVDAGRLSLADAERVYEAQRQLGIPFGEAGMRLSVLSEDDIRFALARQFSYPCLVPDHSKVSRAVVAAYEPYSSAVESVRALRSQIRLRCLDGEVRQNVLTVLSPRRGEGRSWLAANLAVVFAQLGSRTLLIDADLRRPNQHQLFGLDNAKGLSSVISGRAAAEEAVQRIPGLDTLYLLPAGPTPPNPQELLARPQFHQFITRSATAFDVVIIDTPPAAEVADGFAVAKVAGAAVLLARRNRSPLAEVQSIATNVAQVGTTLVGTVLNEF